MFKHGKEAGCRGTVCRFLGLTCDVIACRTFCLKIACRHLDATVTCAAELCSSRPELKDVSAWAAPQEVRYRQRYLDTIVNGHVRDIFVMRANIIRFVRSFLDERSFLEVRAACPLPGLPHLACCALAASAMSGASERSVASRRRHSDCVGWAVQCRGHPLWRFARAGSICRHIWRMAHGNRSSCWLSGYRGSRVICTAQPERAVFAD